MKKYRISFQLGGLLLFLFMMLPSLVWCAIPAPNDILRAESATELLDSIASACQILFAAALCMVENRECRKPRLTGLLLGSIGCGALYYAGWIAYYAGFTNPLVVLALTLPPCLSFLLFSVDRKNLFAFIPALIFTCCHAVYGVVNFII